uniref:Multidrug resistance-associated protein 1 n=1 Tax=Rhabditophanes sp. KR3021 TaxID=114890 RepID=A0AC35UEU9_9BILA
MFAFILAFALFLNGVSAFSNITTGQYLILWIITFIGMLGAQYLCKLNGLLTSGILHITWMLFAVCSLPEIYAIYKNKHTTDLPGTVLFIAIYTIFVLQCILFSYSDSSARPPTHQEGYPSPELYSSFLARVTMWWFNSFVSTGSSKDLEMEDLYDLNEGSTSNHLEALWMKYWGPVIEKYFKQLFLAENDVDGKKPVPPSIIFALFQMFKYEIITAGTCKIIGDCLQFFLPFLLNQMINFVSDKKSPLWLGISYALLMFLVASARSLFLNHYSYLMYRIGTKIQTTLTSATFRKTLKLSTVARKNKTVGEIVNLMAIDVEKYQSASWNILQIFSSPFQIVVCLIYLIKTLGPAALVGALVLVAFVPLNFYSTAFVRKYQVAQMKCKDERVKLCNEMLNGIKVIKLYAWELPISQMIDKIRAKELVYIKKAMLVRSCIDTVNQSSIFLIAFSTFLTYTLVDQEHNLMTPQIVFVSIVLLNQLTGPTMILGYLVNDLIQLSVSNQRLKEFLVSDELKDDAIAKTKEKNELDNAITIENGQFSWDNLYDSKSNLCNVNLTIEKGQLVAIIGKVGSGKSSLINAILGEMTQMNEGHAISINGSISYVPQQPWIQNMSIRDNILFGSDYKARTYNKILRACTLDKDLPSFPNSDMTEIGEKGITLSGGQKARIGLAVAVYSNNDIYLLDDPLSAVDSHVGKHIFQNIIGREGLLRNKTRLLVTNNTLLLDKVDLIIMMEDSKIIKSGTYENLIKDPFFFAFMKDVGTEEEDEDSLMSSSVEHIPDDIEFDNISILTDAEEVEDLEAPLLPSRDITDNINKDLAGAIMTEELAAKGSVTFAVYLTYFNATSPFLVGLFIFFYLGQDVVSLSRNVWLSNWSDTYANNKTQSNISLETRLTVYGLLGALESMAFICSMVAIIFGGIQASKNMHHPLISNIMRWPMRLHDLTPIGRCLQRVGKDVDVIDGTLPLTFRHMAMSLCQITITLTLIVYTTPIFIVVIIPLLILYLFILKVFVPCQRQLQRLTSIARSPIYSHFKETIEGVANIRAYGKESWFVETSGKRIDALIKVAYLSNLSNRWLGLRLEFIGSCILLFTAMFGAISKEMDWTTSAGIIALSISYSINVTDVLNFAVRCVAHLESSIVSVERVSEYSNMETEPDWRNEKGNICGYNWPSRGEIKIENYSTRYREGLDLVIKNLSIHIKGGDNIGIVGRTGSGKSSLALALFRMIEPVEGKIIIDDVDISEIGLHDLREHITIIPQDPVLFSADLRFNLDPFNNYNDDQVWEALEHSHMKDFVINKLENGLQAIVTEAGSNFSVGQRQLLCLTRALLRRSRLIVLDEMSSSVDQQTDQIIQETIRQQFADSTIIAIAHRIDTLINYDQIMVMDQGNIIEYDTPANLLSNKKSAFYSLALDAGLVKE